MLKDMKKCLISMLLVSVVSGCGVHKENLHKQKQESVAKISLETVKEEKLTHIEDFMDSRIPFDITKGNGNYTFSYEDDMHKINTVVENVVYKDMEKESVIENISKAYKLEVKEQYEKDLKEGYKKVEELTSQNMTNSMDGSLMSVGSKYIVKKVKKDKTLAKLVLYQYCFNNKTRAKTEVVVVFDNKELKDLSKDSIKSYLNGLIYGELDNLIASIKWGKEEK